MNVSHLKSGISYSVVVGFTVQEDNFCMLFSFYSVVLIQDSIELFFSIVFISLDAKK